MIRINLLRSRVAGVGEGATEAAATTLATSIGGSGDGREIALKIFLIAIGVLGLMIWESQNLRALNEELARKQAQVNQLTTDNAAKAADVAKVKDVELQAKELEDKLKILKLLSKLRLREVKTLDFMQSSIPEKVWLRNVSYEVDKTNVEQGHYTFAGNAVNTEELAEFVKRLEESAYLQDVIVVKNQETPVNKATTVREFLFTAEVENKN